MHAGTVEYAIVDVLMPPFSSFLHRRDRRRPPEWDAEGPRGRVLLEHPDPRVRKMVEQRLREHGYGVLTCAGPDSGGRGIVGCPLYAERSCSAIDGADAVVIALDLDEDAAHQHVDLVVAAAPDRPVIVDPALRGAGGRLDTPHRLYRTTIAPLVRQLHDLLHSPHRSGPGT